MDATTSVYRNCSLTIGADGDHFYWEYDTGSFVTYSMDSYATSDEAMAAARAEIDAEAVAARGRPFERLADTPTAADNWTYSAGNLGMSHIDSLSLFSTSGDPTFVYGLNASVTGRSLEPVPEPSSLGLMAVGMFSCGGFAFMRRRRFA